MSSTTSSGTGTGIGTPKCHADFIPQMPFLKLLQCALQQQPTPSTSHSHSHMHHFLDFQDNYHCHSDVTIKPKIEQMDSSCITHDIDAPPPPPNLLISLPAPPTITISMCDSKCNLMPKPRKRKRPCTSATKKKPQQVECQRITHITVERNRRRLMNEYFATLKSLIPAYLVERGDQASVVGGAIHFIKDLEQQVLSLQAEKRSRGRAGSGSGSGTTTNTDSVATNLLEGLGFFISPQAQYKGYSSSSSSSSCCRGELGGVDVEATVVQGHINLKVAVAGRRRQSHHQLLAFMAALQELKMSVLHFMLTAIDARSVLYCFSLKMEEGCALGSASADEIAAAVHHIFSYS